MTQTGRKETEFWQALQALVRSSEIHIDRPAGSRHPHFPDMIYPLDYGYLRATHSNDRDNLDLWIGTRTDRSLDGVLLTVDPGKRESEIKLLLGCTEGDQLVIENFFARHGMAAWTILRKESHEIDTGSLSGPGRG